MQSDALSQSYISVEGPQGLRNLLHHLLDQTQTLPDFSKEHYILYCMGSQKSLIKLDISQRPFLFWYYDLLGRPATKAVKDILADFTWEKGGEKERYLESLSNQLLVDKE